MSREIAPPGCASDGRFRTLAAQIEKAQPGTVSVVMSGNLPGCPGSPRVTVVGDVDPKVVEQIAGNAGVIALVDTSPEQQNWAPPAECWAKTRDGFEAPVRVPGELWVIQQTLPIIQQRNNLYYSDHGGQVPQPYFVNVDGGQLPADLRDFLAFGQSSLKSKEAHTLYCGVTGVAQYLSYKTKDYGFHVGDRVTFVDADGKPNRGIIGAVDRNPGKVEVLAVEPNANVPGSGQTLVGGFTMDPAELLLAHRAKH
jgi:hypothetical protein